MKPIRCPMENPRPWKCMLRVECLESRFPLGDALLSTLLGTSWLAATADLAGSAGNALAAEITSSESVLQTEPLQHSDLPSGSTDWARPTASATVQPAETGEAAIRPAATAKDLAPTAPFDDLTSGFEPTSAGAAIALNRNSLVGGHLQRTEVPGGIGATSLFRAPSAPASTPSRAQADASSGRSDEASLTAMTRGGDAHPVLGPSPSQPLRLAHGRGNVISDVLPIEGPADNLLPLPLPPNDNGTINPFAFNWDQKFQGANWTFEDISFADTQNGFAAAELGKVLRTQDGGATWTSVMDLGFPYYWYGVHALDSQRVVVSGFNNQTGDGILRWTADGGDTWSDIFTVTGNQFPIHWLDKIAFVDDANGIAMASWAGGDHVTATGGQTADDWNYVQADPTNAWFQGNFTYWADGNVWTSGINFCHSTDGGQTWACQHSIDPIFDGGGVSFPDPDHGWVAGGEIAPDVRGWVHRTDDGGATWSDRILDVPFPIRSVLFLNDQVGFAAGGTWGNGAGGIYSTTDGGDTWDLDISTGAEIRSLNAVWASPDGVDVWAAGFGPNFTGKIFTTEVDLSA
jgi:photosystem II stability/assembly factor-like uncharacterized protein